MTIRLSSEADLDYSESLLYYLTEGSPHAAVRFSEELDIAYRDIMEAPNRNRISVFGLREKHLAKFPFSVLYSVEGEEVFVHAIYHDDRTRSKLRKRL